VLQGLSERRLPKERRKRKEIRIGEENVETCWSQEVDSEEW
jgi:hypothetical protein